MILLQQMLMYGKEERNRKQEIDRQYHTIRIKDQMKSIMESHSFIHIFIILFLIILDKATLMTHNKSDMNVAKGKR